MSRVCWGPANHRGSLGISHCTWRSLSQTIAHLCSSRLGMLWPKWTGKKVLDLSQTFSKWVSLMGGPFSIQLSDHCFLFNMIHFNLLLPGPIKYGYRIPWYLHFSTLDSTGSWGTRWPWTLDHRFRHFGSWFASGMGAEAITSGIWMLVTI